MCMLLCRTNKQFWIIKLIDFFCLPQLQEAFAQGLLKPGMNVLVNKQKKLVNSVVSFVHLFTFSSRVQSNSSGQVQCERL